MYNNYMLRFTAQVFITLAIFFLILFVYTKVAGPIPFSVSSVNTNKSDTFSVTGTGKVSATPDSASVRAGVTTNGSTAEAAQRSLNTSVNKVSDAIKALGIDAKDIKTENYNVNPNYEYTSGSQKIIGYTANTNLVIKVNDPTKANQVLDTATANGANQVGGVNFETEDSTAAENEARKKAVEDAKKKAEDAARIAGFKLGRIINYSESFNGVNPPLPYAAKSEDLGPGNLTNLEPGSKEIVVNVTLSYEVR